MSHVDKHYDLLVGGQELRIVAVRQEYGRIDLEGRTAMIDKSASAGFSGRNPHMHGTPSILGLLLVRRPGSDDEEERLSGENNATAPIFDGFALVNAILCSAPEKPPEGSGSGKGASSRPTR